MAVLEAQRQTEMFVKLDRRSYTDLSTRPRSGLLTSIFHPDPELFPEGHPYKYSRSTHDILAAPIRGIYANPSPALVGNAQVPHQPQPEAQLGGIQQQLQRQRQQQLQLLQQQELQLQARQQQQQLQAQQQQAQHQPRPQQPRRNLLNGLQMSRASAAGPVAANVTVQGSSVIVSPTMQVPGNPTQRSNLRLKGRPDNEELEESSGEEDNENRLPMASSLAMQKLAAFTERQQQSRQNRQQQQQTQAQAQDEAPQQRPQMTRAHTAIGTTSQLPTPPIPEEEPIPSRSMAAASAPIPFLYPYDQMPVPMPVLSPRRNRLTMLSNELPESLRRNLLWERQVNKHRPMGGAMRTHGGLGGGGRVAPDTSLGPTTAENYEERLRIAKARNKSWADEFHGAGW